MGRSPYTPNSDENGSLKKGPWTTEEDKKLVDHIHKHGHGSWRALPKLSGLNRCGKSCRLRWTNYLRPNIKRGKFTQEEEQTILHLHSILGNKWSAIASHLAGRTDNEIKNFWNTHLKKKLIQMGYDPMTHRPRTDILSSLPNLIALANLLQNNPFDEAAQLVKLQYLQYLLYSVSPSPTTTNYNLEDLAAFNNSQMENVLTSQLLHNLGTEPLLTLIQNPQVPFNLHSQLNNIDMNQNSSNFMMNSHQGDDLHDSPWILPSPAPSIKLPPLMETSMSINPRDASSTSSNGEGRSSYWKELLSENPLLHDMS